MRRKSTRSGGALKLPPELFDEFAPCWSNQREYDRWRARHGLTEPAVRLLRPCEPNRYMAGWGYCRANGIDFRMLMAEYGTVPFQSRYTGGLFTSNQRNPE